jgi:hypothetical protein
MATFDPPAPPAAAPRFIQIAHVVPGRARFRLAWLRHDRSEATDIADALQALPGMKVVELRPFTGSLLCQHDRDRLDAGVIAQELQRITGGAPVLARGEHPPTPTYTGALRSLLANEVNALFRDANDVILRNSQGMIDLGTIAAGGLAAASAVKVLTDRRLPAPQWFNLAWWGFRTFLTFENDIIVAAVQQPEESPAAEG